MGADQETPSRLQEAARSLGVSEKRPIQEEGDMKKTATVMLTAALLAVGLASPASAAPTEDTSSSLGIESGFGVQVGDTWVSAYSLVYEVEEGGQPSTVVVPTIFVDGASSLECWAFTDEADVSIDPRLTGGSYKAELEGQCFDFVTEEGLPFSVSFDIEATGTGSTWIRGGSYASDGKRCVSQRRERDATATGQMSVAIPDRGIDVTAEVSDASTALTGFSQRCYAMNGNLPTDDH